jgi:hypothetical protein
LPNQKSKWFAGEVGEALGGQISLVIESPFWDRLVCFGPRRLRQTNATESYLDNHSSLGGRDLERDESFAFLPRHPLPLQFLQRLLVDGKIRNEPPRLSFRAS